MSSNHGTPSARAASAFESLFAAAPHPMWMCDAAGRRILKVNAAARDRSGHAPEALAGRTMDELFRPAPGGPAGPPPGPGWTGPWQLRRADGALLDVTLTTLPLEVDGRAVLVVSADDLGARQRAEEALRRGEEQYRSVVNSIRQVIFRTDPRGAWTFLNAAWTEITGFTVAETLGETFLRYVHPEDRRSHAESFQALTTTGAECGGHVARYVTRAGGYRWLEVVAQLLVDGEGRVQGMFGTMTDITERRRAEEELLAARARLEHLLVSGPAVIYSRGLTPPYPLTFVSENLRVQLGEGVEAALGDPGFWLVRLHPEDAQPALAALGRLVSGGGEPGRSQQYRMRHADGRYRWIHDERRLVRDDAGRPVEIVGSWVDVTEHRLAADERARMSSVVEQSAEAIVITTPDGAIEYVNPACERLTGYSRAELVGQSPRLLHAATDDGLHATLRATLAAGQPWSGRLVSRRKDGTQFDAEVLVGPVRDAAGRVVNFVGGMRDVTQQRQVEEQLRQAQKMEIAGRLAGGVAHDFNNLLTVIIGRTQLLLAKLPAEAPARRDLELILDTAGRAAGLTRQLLAFSRKQAAVPRVLDLNEVVTGMEKILRQVLGEDIELVVAAAPGLGRIKGDPGQLEQVIMNLAVNARDAMPAGGRLTLETADVELDEAYARAHVGVRAGAHVMLAVGDTGCGIDPGVLPHIFEPFFTTKSPDRGTGLGLSTVYGIVAQSEGHIAVESRPGEGTTFRIYLPRVQEPLTAAVVAGARLRPDRGSETVLLAEDEEYVRSLAREVLLRQGYTVLEAGNGAEALEVAAAHPGPVHLLVTDVVMPVMGGRELAQRLARLRPEMRILYTSGYTAGAAGTGRPVTPLLEKPFTLEALAGKVREVLDGPLPAGEERRREMEAAHGGLRSG